MVINQRIAVMTGYFNNADLKWAPGVKSYQRETFPEMLS